MMSRGKQFQTTGLLRNADLVRIFIAMSVEIATGVLALKDVVNVRVCFIGLFVSLFYLS